MKKSLIALAVAGAFAAPAAMADVTLSGAINIGIDGSRSSDGSVSGSGISRTSLHPSYSNMNVSSTDDIGNGNKVIFNYQLDISGSSTANPTNAGGAIGNRNSYLGFKGGWGAFKVGTNENVYERLQYESDPLDGAVGPGGNLNILGTPGAGRVFEVGQGGCTALAGCVDFYRRAEQEIWFESANYNGFTFEADYTLSTFKTSSTPGPSLNPGIISLGGKYQAEGMPWYVDAGYERHKDMFGLNTILAATPGSGGIVAGATGSTDTAIEVGGGYMFGDIGLHARYEQLKYKEDGGANANGVSEYKRTAYWLGVKYNLPTGYVGGEFGIAQKGKTNVSDADQTGAKMFGIGYFHNLSKQSQLQFIYARTDNEGKATYAQIDAAGGSPGSKLDVVSVRLKHTF
jgi:predicted porin